MSFLKSDYVYPMRIGVFFIPTQSEEHHYFSLFHFKTWGYDMRRGKNVSWESYGHYTTDLITDEAVELIRQHEQHSPMFLYVAHLAVHSANDYQFLEAPEYVIKKFDYIKNENRRTFAGVLINNIISYYFFITSITPDNLRLLSAKLSTFQIFPLLVLTTVLTNMNTVT